MTNNFFKEDLDMHFLAKIPVLIKDWKALDDIFAGVVNIKSQGIPLEYLGHLNDVAHIRTSQRMISGPRKRRPS